MRRQRIARLSAAILALGAICAPIHIQADRSTETPLWTDAGKQAEGRVFRLDEDALARTLQQAPPERPGESKTDGAVLAVPMPDGSLQRLRIREAPVMEPELARKYPEIRTYVGQGIDDPTATARIDFTPLGFHAMVLSAAGDVFVDPTRGGKTDSYVSYRGADAERRRFACFALPSETAKRTDLAVPLGTTLRTYRLAVAATGEYTQFHGGSVQNGMSAVVSTVNRVTGIYERDLAIRLVLVNGEDQLIYTDPNNDPYTNDNSDALLDENQNNIDQVIGNQNYDIGHVVGTGGGGVAVPGVCVLADKAKGVTGSEQPFGDAFDIDYVAHEMGHQFGANHTFNNGTNGSCGGGNRVASVAYEPGSGSTILGYTGICGQANIQPNSDAYFHLASIEEITNWTIQNACAATTATANQPPTVDAGQSLTIPARTPFALTAQGNDPDGDALTYCWEQFDLGPASPPEGDDGRRPILRSYSPTASPTRTFPQMASLLAGTPTPWEILPTTNRTLTFRVTVRDNRAGGGGVNFAETTLRVLAGVGPFVITSPAAGETWGMGSRATVRWNVAGTDGGQVGTANVRILLSTDGGQTFPHVLAESTPNDGLEAVTVPGVMTETARIKVEAVGNVFFDVSRANFRIGEGSTGTTPVITSVSSLVVAGKPYRIRIVGDAFLEGVQVFVGESAQPWSPVKRKSATTLVLKKGATLEAAFPAGVATRIRIVNPDGGEASTTFTR